MWKTDYVKEVRFDETLKNLVDTEMFHRTNKIDKGVLLLAEHNFGYYYRQHSDNVSGNKFDIIEKHKNKEKENLFNNIDTIAEMDGEL